jgi:uncharacterized membrane protein YbhN (UPF0104 family)
MSASGVSDVGIGRARRGGLDKIALAAAKVAVTVACFWLVFRQIDAAEVLGAMSRLDWRWTPLGVAIAVLQIPIVGLRWRRIVAALAALTERMTRPAVIAATAVGTFFMQVAPSVAGEGVRAWLLVRLGASWRNAVTSVLIDRVVGVGILIALGFVILLLPSGLNALGGYRDHVLIVYGALLGGGALGLLLTPVLAPLLARWRYSRWAGLLATDVHRVLLGRSGPVVLALGALVHLLTIVVIWSVGRAQGLMLPASDAAVLYTVMIGVALVPISVGGWGLRELAVVSVLGRHGIAPEQALIFSVCFGLVLAVGSLPGAAAWLFFPFGPPPAAGGRLS